MRQAMRPVVSDREDRARGTMRPPSAAQGPLPVILVEAHWARGRGSRHIPVALLDGPDRAARLVAGG